MRACIYAVRCLILSFALISLKDFAVPPEVISRATQVKAKGKMVCNLLRSLFTREELATSSLKGSHQALNKNTLDERKVEAITSELFAFVKVK